jgi:hypothetical protein
VHGISPLFWCVRFAPPFPIQYPIMISILEMRSTTINRIGLSFSVICFPSKLTIWCLFSFSGVVPKPTGQVAQNGEMLGTVDHHGRVRTLRGHGPPLAAIAGHDRQIGKGKRMRRPLVTRYVPLIFSLFLIHSIAHNIILDKIRRTTDWQVDTKKWLLKFIFCFPLSAFRYAPEVAGSGASADERRRK